MWQRFKKWLTYRDLAGEVEGLKRQLAKRLVHLEAVERSMNEAHTRAAKAEAMAIMGYEAAFQARQELALYKLTGHTYP
jgi:hypothetical protein